ncbi:Reductase [Fictibacillus macauensis ZFHKF-1]|uniref:Reductase n=1 Tax=Fictibacillus macauensis ZFHKF-1 TaxID=1196324 RepID=I8AM61_9BACL|nr:NAD(P)/FAD-dependent oxidoreductase [Fictibacillus macauensis]EIT86754.1 Reductase [Fictibacillus macauensis ZFHKF-1]
MLQYECLIIGGGIAGLQAGIQLGRYQRNVLLVDAHSGRSSLCRKYRNLLGYPDGVSGKTLRENGQKQLEKVGVPIVSDYVTAIERQGDGTFVVSTATTQWQTQTLLLATGITDRLPAIPSLKECLGESIYICPDCDGYEALDRNVIVIGAGEAGCQMALALLSWARRVTYIHHEDPLLSANQKHALQQQGISYVQKKVKAIITSRFSIFAGVQLEDDSLLMGDCAFVAFGGNIVHTELLRSLGVHMHKGHIVTDARTKETSIHNIWAAGDVTAHSEQVAIAMGDGVQAAIWIQKKLKGMKKS